MLTLSEDKENKIYKFSEKPKKPDSNLASMGIYIFDTEVLLDAITTVQDDNIFNIAIKGNFDDCQKIVKELFIDDSLFYQKLYWIDGALRSEEKDE